MGVRAAFCRGLALACLMGSLPAAAQALRFRHFTQADGLPVNAIRSVHQDVTGFLWIGTHEGLARYDGYEFRTFRNDPRDPASLSDNIVTAVTGDGDVGLWLATLNGLNRFDARSERFATVAHGHAAPDRVYALAPDGQGGLWLGCEQGLSHVDAKGQALAVPTLPEGEVRALASEGQDALWIGQMGGGLHRLALASGQLQSYRAAPGRLPEDRVTALAVDGKRLWVGMRGAGLASLETASGAWRHYPPEPGRDDALADGAITSLFLDPEKALWVGTFEGGLHRLRAGQAGFERFRHNPALPGSLSHDTVRAIFQDRSGVLWVATREGLDKYDTYQARFHNLAHDPADPESLSHNTVGALLEGADGALWVGTQPGGLNRVDPLTGKSWHFRFGAETPNSLNDDMVWSLSEDRAGRLWVGTGSGLNRYRPDSGDFQRYTGAGAPQGQVRALLGDAQGMLWIASDAGLLRLAPESGQFQAWRAGDAPDSLSSDRVGQLAEGEAGDIWMAFDGELNRLERATGKPRRYRPEDPAEVGPNNEVGYLADDGDGGFWLASSQGLKHFNRETGRFRAIEALPRVLLLGVVDDGRGGVWAPSNRGLYRYEPATGRVRAYYGEDGLQGDEFNAGAFARGRQALYFGGTGGVSRFEPSALADHPVKPTVAFTELRLFNRPQAVGTRLLPQALNSLRSIALDYRDDVLSVGFAGLELASPGRIGYRYRLLGLDERWIETGPEARSAQFTDLAPGDYVLEIAARNKHGIDAESRRLGIQVAPPPWRSTPAYLAYALALFGLVYAWHARQRARFQNALRIKAAQAEALVRAVDERTAELRERNTAIAHLLDNAGQGFLSFGPDLRIAAEYSQECERLLGQGLAGRPVATVLHPDDAGAAGFLAGVLRDWLTAESGRRALFHGLLPERLRLAGRNLSITWRDLGASCLAVLTDISAEVALAQEVELERNHLRRVLKAVQDPAGMHALTEDFRGFAQGDAARLLSQAPSLAQALVELRRAVHTYKGCFAQIEFETCRAGLAALEDALAECEAETLPELLASAWLAWLEEDLGVLEHYLGRDYLDQAQAGGLDAALVARIERGLAGELDRAGLDALHAELRALAGRPFAELLAGYPALVRELAEVCGKAVATMPIEGGELRVDPERYAGFARSLVHVFRNLVDHGIEDAETRLAAGKPLQGQLRCQIQDQGDAIALLIADDGAGIDVAAVRERAVEQGLLDAETAAALHDSAIWALIFADGLSTRADVSDLSGRGIGLAAVRAEVEKLGGELRVGSIPGRGTSFVFRLPKG
ncbi:MAG: hypothetical protein HYV16_11480 [Gammaproteobacteria bacterium]|nr:hypothetical protein [Gammaproteobacteria bacterium]